MATATASENSILVNVKKTNGKSQAYLLDTTDTLDTVRTFLTGKKLMSINDSFLFDGGTAVDRDQEAQITLGDVIKDKVLMIGAPANGSAIDPADGVARYNLLNDDQKRAIFENVQIFRGLTFGANTFGKSFKDVYTWAPGYTPAANTPRVITELVSNYAFNKATSELKNYSSQSASVNVSSPYGSADAEYKTEQSKTTSTSKVTEYLSTKYIVRKADLQVDPQSLVVTPDFVAAVRTALKGNESTLDGYHNLVSVLNDYGYYIPVEFTLGGAILGTDQTDISDLSEAETHKQEFNASFKAEFEGIGGGGAYGEASGSDKTTTTSTKFQNITMELIGGSPGLEKDYPEWAKSLNAAIQWGMADVSKFRPTLVLLASDDEGRQILGTAINLLDKFASAPRSAELQPYIDMRAYNSSLQVLVNPFA
ncbi:MAG TPA: MAC/perforin domain-containing protein [Thermoanaerobaculia bacterium]|jgi:hypothetical protein